MSAVAGAGTGARRAARSLVALASRPAGWALAAIVLGVALGIGSVHPAPPTRAARIAALESSLKCPNCVDLSIRQSDTAAAANLRAEVVRLVDEGRSDAQIEAIVVGQYGSSELLSPPASGIDTLAWALPVAALVGGGGALAVVLVRRRRRSSVRPEASDEDEALVRAALGQVAAAGAARAEAPGRGPVDGPVGGGAP